MIKNESKVREGIEKVNKLSKRSKNIEVKITDDNFQDLLNSFDLEASLFTAKATLLIALARNESRGAHQRSDFRKKERKFLYNFIIYLENNSINLERRNLPKLNQIQKKVINESVSIENYEGRLLE